MSSANVPDISNKTTGQNRKLRKNIKCNLLFWVQVFLLPPFLMPKYERYFKFKWKQPSFAIEPFFTFSSLLILMFFCCSKYWWECLKVVQAQEGQEKSSSCSLRTKDRYVLTWKVICKENKWGLLSPLCRNLSTLLWMRIYMTLQTGSITAVRPITYN